MHSALQFRRVRGRWVNSWDSPYQRGKVCRQTLPKSWRRDWHTWAPYPHWWWCSSPARLSCRTACSGASSLCIWSDLLELGNLPLLPRSHCRRVLALLSGNRLIGGGFDGDGADGGGRGRVFGWSAWVGGYLVRDLDRLGAYFSCVFFLMACSSSWRMLNFLNCECEDMPYLNYSPFKWKIVYHGARGRG